MSEQISALMDEEIAVDDAAHLISSMQSSKQAAEAWSQYNLIGDVMRGNQLLSKDFKQNLMLKLDQEPTILAPKSAQVKADQLAVAKDRIPAKWSIAASVAAVMVVGWMAMQQVQTGNEVPAIEMAQAEVVEQKIPDEYMAAHQSSAPSATSCYIQSVSYAE
jgi:sigma-E factor negative regulatory protein RseA